MHELCGGRWKWRDERKNENTKNETTKLAVDSHQTMSEFIGKSGSFVRPASPLRQKLNGPNTP